MISNVLGVTLIGLYISITLALAYGWVMNIVTLLNDGYETTIQIVLSVIGIITAPLGSIVYYVAG